MNTGTLAHPAGYMVVPVDLLERTICRLTHGHEHDKAVRELRALLSEQQQASAAQSAPADSHGSQWTTPYRLHKPTK